MVHLMFNIGTLTLRWPSMYLTLWLAPAEIKTDVDQAAKPPSQASITLCEHKSSTAC